MDLIAGRRMAGSWQGLCRIGNTALIDLDLNKDGVIDLSEFCRWYFTGMKPYNGGRRSLLKFGAQSVALMDALKEESRALLMS